MNRPFNELVKEFNLIRSYARDFYINGFKQRDDFQTKSLRSYDNERRRIESYLSKYLTWEQNTQGKKLRLDLNQETLSTNPLFSLWQTKSFTKNDLFLHFVLLDCLANQEALSLSELTDRIHTQYLTQFENSPILSEITVRNKLKEYCQLGIVKQIEKEKHLYYQFVAPLNLEKKWIPVLHFYKEILPIGVIGQFLLNQFEQPIDSPFSFKHHFIVHTLDEEIVLELLTAITKQCYVQLIQSNKKQVKMVPLALYNSTETGRQYLVGFIRKKHLTSVRVDTIEKVNLGNPVNNYNQLKQRFLVEKNTSWNGSFNQKSLQKLRVFLRIEEETEDYLTDRLTREQRMGTSYRLDSHTVVFEIELTDLFAINPFLRTFIGRIISIESTDKKWRNLFIQDMKTLISLYERTEEVTTDD